MHATKLGGYSGCKVLLLESENGNIFVRKISSEIGYNKRLIAQSEKQEKYQNDEIQVPQILDKGMTDDGLFYFDMEYIRGSTLAEFMKIVEVNKIRALAETLTHSVVRFEKNDQSDEEIFQKKIKGLADELSKWGSNSLEKGLDMLEHHDWSKFSWSPCHGDLTLDNIIVKGDRLYLIDFLDSFYESWLLDMGTLFQDIQTLWSYRNEEELDINTVIRLIIFRDILLDEIRRMAGTEYIIETYYALLLKLIRIFPYTLDAKTQGFLEQKIDSVIRLINEVGK